MIGICPKCGNYDWDKQVLGNHIQCPKCAHVWAFRKLPMFVLTGCSGVGKTTTAQALMQRDNGLVVLDADMFYGILSPQTDEQYLQWVEQIESLSKNIMQSGQPVLWAMAGNLDKLNCVYNRRFISNIHCMALVCDENALRQRMIKGRGITDEKWIQSSVAYNQYFQTHNRLHDMPFETFDITGKDVSEVADYVEQWVKARFQGE